MFFLFSNNYPENCFFFFENFNAVIETTYYSTGYIDEPGLTTLNRRSWQNSYIVCINLYRLLRRL